MKNIVHGTISPYKGAYALRINGRVKAISYVPSHLEIIFKKYYPQQGNTVQVTE